MDTRIKKALALLKQGKAPTFTAKSIGVHQSALAKMFHKEGLPLPKVIWKASIARRIDPSISVMENARRLNVNKKLIEEELKKCSR